MNKKRKEYRVGEFNRNNKGLLMTIIRYGNAKDIDVKFENGIIIKHKEYSKFKQGAIACSISNLEDLKTHIENKEKEIKEEIPKEEKKETLKQIIKHNRKGEINTNKQGIVMEIVNYRNENDIDVQLSHKNIHTCIMTHKTYSDFQKGTILYKGKSDLVVSALRDSQSTLKKLGTEIDTKKVSNKTGEINYNKQGEKMTIIFYNGITDIDVQFEDGTIVRHKQYYNFASGELINPNYLKKKFFGQSVINIQKLKMVIIDYQDYNNITVMFEDGTIVRHQKYDDFHFGYIKNPNIITEQHIETDISYSVGMELEQYINLVRLEKQDVIERAILNYLKEKGE